MGNEYKNGRMTEYKDLDIFFLTKFHNLGHCQKYPSQRWKESYFDMWVQSLQMRQSRLV